MASSAERPHLLAPSFPFMGASKVLPCCLSGSDDPCCCCCCQHLSWAPEHPPHPAHFPHGSGESPAVAAERHVGVAGPRLDSTAKSVPTSWVLQG
eukprot:1159439-Pelagomonas_calceolata.AAC.1